ncbi:DNA adenine methylase [Campylobacter sp. RM15925]|uniref:DNA adenine methylase n=1 Tax=Campylobacter sp. RM15925 TaxID=1705724 RepID=UPI001474D8C4|nr:DNA adenine methylase [Campylobacter sp. RM15925]
MISDVKPEISSENKAFLTEQILTYLGNKRSLLGFIEQGVLHAKSELRRDKLSCTDVFSGSGIVARFLKRHANFIVANDLELYSKITNECYLANLTPELKAELKTTLAKLKKEIKSNFKSGFITELYSPKDEASITPNDRVFYTPYNARYIDTARASIELLDEEIRPFFLAPLLHSASVHANTSGVFKGFYKNKDKIGQFGGEGKNALKRILAPIELKMPVFSNFNVEFEVMQKDANLLAGEIGKIDLAYLDPPYNQHPYGSNYFMLNLIAKYERPSEISKVSGIAKDWNRSVYNQRANTAEAFFDLIRKLKAKFVIISFNSEGFISKESFEKNLKKFGKVELKEQKYNAFRGSRNLKSRSLHVNELLFILKKQS